MAIWMLSRVGRVSRAIFNTVHETLAALLKPWRCAIAGPQKYVLNVTFTGVCWSAFRGHSPRYILAISSPCRRNTYAMPFVP